MKKIVLTLLSFFFLIAISPVFAAPIPVATIQLAPPSNFGINPNTPLNDVFSNALRIVFIIAAILVLIYLIWGAFQWITSGGDKEAVGKARGRITAALVGLAILALAFFILQVVGSIINVNILGGFQIPKLGNTVP